MHSKLVEDLYVCIVDNSCNKLLSKELSMC